MHERNTQVFYAGQCACKLLAENSVEVWSINIIKAILESPSLAP